LIPEIVVTWPTLALICIIFESEVGRTARQTGYAVVTSFTSVITNRAGFDRWHKLKVSSFAYTFFVCWKLTVFGGVAS
jgi:hypothetical protein